MSQAEEDNTKSTMSFWDGRLCHLPCWNRERLRTCAEREGGGREGGKERGGREGEEEGEGEGEGEGGGTEGELVTERMAETKTQTDKTTIQAGK